jgi:hypothetical protein
VVRLEGLAHGEVKAVKKYVKTVRNTDEDFNRQDLIDDTVKEAIEIIFETKYPDEFESWPTWSDELFFDSLLICCPDETSNVSVRGLSQADKLLPSNATYLCGM